MQYARQKVSNVDKGNSLSLTHFSSTQAICSQCTNTHHWLLLLLRADVLSLNTGKYLNYSTSTHGQAEELVGLPGLAIRDGEGHGWQTAELGPLPGSSQLANEVLSWCESLLLLLPAPWGLFGGDQSIYDQLCPAVLSPGAGGQAH